MAAKIDSALLVQRIAERLKERFKTVYMDRNALPIAALAVDLTLAAVAPSHNPEDCYCCNQREQRAGAAAVEAFHE